MCVIGDDARGPRVGAPAGVAERLRVAGSGEVSGLDRPFEMLHCSGPGAAVGAIGAAAIAGALAGWFTVVAVAVGSSDFAPLPC